MNRHLDLGGSSKAEDKKALLERAKQERLQRQHLIQSAKSASRLQAWWRKFGAKKIVWKDMRKEWDSLWTIFAASQQGKASKTLSIDSITRLVRLLVIFFDPKEDERRFLSVCACIVRGVGNDPHRNYFLSFSEPHGSWFALKRFILLAMAQLQLQVKETGRPKNDQVFRLILNVLVLLSDPTKWALPQSKAETVSHAFFTTVWGPAVAQHSLFTHLRRVIDSILSVPSKTTKDKENEMVYLSAILAVASQALRPLALAAFPAQLARIFCAEILSVPGAADYLAQKSLNWVISTSGGVNNSDQLPQGPLLSLLHQAAALAYDSRWDPLSRAKQGFGKTEDEPSHQGEESGPPTQRTFLTGNIMTLAAKADLKSQHPTIMVAFAYALTALLTNQHTNIFEVEEWWQDVQPPTIKKPSTSAPLLASSSSSSTASRSKKELAETLAAQRASEVRTLTAQLQLFLTPKTLTTFAFRPLVAGGDDTIKFGEYFLAPEDAASKEAVLAQRDFIVRQFEAFMGMYPRYVGNIGGFYLAILRSTSSTRFSCASVLAFSTPLLLLMWTCLEIKVGSTLVDPAPKTGWKGKPVKPQEYEGRLRGMWLDALCPLGSPTGGDQEVVVMLSMFLECYLSVLFVLEDDELKLLHPPFRSLEELRQFTRLLKNLAFRLLWDFDGEAPAHLEVLLPRCQKVIRELYKKDVRCRFMRDSATASEPKLVVPPTSSGKKPSSFWKLKSLLSGKSSDEKVMESGSASEWALEGRAKEDWVKHWQSFIAAPPPGSLSPEDETTLALRAIKTSSILNQLPFVVSFPDRVQLLRRFIEEDRAKYGRGQVQTAFGAIDRPGCEFVIRRSRLVLDAFDSVSRVGKAFKQRVMVKFLDNSGNPEQGVDLGGPFKEFLEEICKEIFRPEYGLFSTTPNGEFYPNPCTTVVPDFLQFMEFVGKIVGKALYEGILINIPFASFFLCKLLGQGVVVSDLEVLDPQLYKSLIILKYYEGNVEDLALTFSISDNTYGELKEIELRPKGTDVPVTNENRVEYMYKVADFRLNKQLRAQSNAFVSGMSQVLDMRWVRMFNVPELRVLLSGSSADLDIDDWKRHCKYDGVSSSNKVVRMFWETMEKFSPEERQAVLRFATGTSRPPLLGFAHLNPPFAIRIVENPKQPRPVNTSSLGALVGSVFGDQTTNDFFPSAATCFNLLKLPNYSSQKVLETKLKVAIQQAPGFQLN